MSFDNWTVEQFRTYQKTGDKPLKKNKFGAKRTVYKGISYDSKREAKHAADLDLLILAGKVNKWERQHKIVLDVKGEHVCNYFIDFKVFLADGSIEYHEVKGAETALWRQKWKLTKILYPDFNLIIIK